MSDVNEVRILNGCVSVAISKNSIYCALACDCQALFSMTDYVSRRGVSFRLGNATHFCGIAEMIGKV